MKVILLGCTPPPVGGIAQWTVRMLESKLNNGWEIDLVDEKMIGGRESFGNKTKKNYFIEAIRWSKIWYELHTKLRQKNAPVVHACLIASNTSMMANIVSALLTQLHGKHFISHFRCTIPNMINSKKSVLLLKIICNTSKKIIVLNKQSAEYLSNITKTEVEIIPNFVDIDDSFFTRSTKNVIKTALYVGGCTKEKGCLALIELAKRFPDIDFVLIGKPDSEVMKAAKSVNNIILKGVLEQTEVRHHMENSDIFLFLSSFWGEGFSNALAEAMAAGLPCIVTRWAANADMIDDCKGGFVVDVGSIDQAEHAIHMIESKNIRTSFSDYNYTKARNEYSSKLILSRYVNIYEEFARNV